MNRLSEEQVLQLAPDASSLKSGKDLANVKKWLNFKYNERVLWGEMQGSGKDPYRTQIDLVSTAFKCSCPSRKFPCKHGLGLFLLFARDPSVMKQTNDEPTWVKEWIDKRQAKAEKIVEPIVEIDDKTQAKREKDKLKRENERLALVQAGATELELWLKDLLRSGFLSLPEKGSGFFDKTAARMVDAKATGLANMVKGFTKINFYNGTGWHSEVLAQAAGTFLLLESFKNIEKQTPSVQEDIRSLVGWSQKKAELLEDETGEKISDTWLVLNRLTEQEDDLTIQKHWLFGAKTSRFALILDFSYKNTPFSNLLVAGTWLDAELVFYPSNMPFRAVIKNQGATKAQFQTPISSSHNWQKAQEAFVEKLMLNAWADELPQILSQLTVAKHNDMWFLQDTEGGLMPINRLMSFEKMMQLLALTGGKALDMAVLRTQDTVVPLGVFVDNNYKIIKI